MTWEVGDLALCVDAEPQVGDTMRHPGLVEGRTYTIAGVYHAAGILDRSAYGVTLREIAPIGNRLGFLADRFRKILPDKHEQCEPEFVTLLKRIKRTAPVEAASDWLIRAGPIAKELNEQSRKDQ